MRKKWKCVHRQQSAGRWLCPELCDCRTEVSVTWPSVWSGSSESHASSTGSVDSLTSKFTAWLIRWSMCLWSFRWCFSSTRNDSGPCFSTIMPGNQIQWLLEKSQIKSCLLLGMNAAWKAYHVGLFQHSCPWCICLPMSGCNKSRCDHRGLPIWSSEGGHLVTQWRVALSGGARTLKRGQALVDLIGTLWRDLWKV